MNALPNMSDATFKSLMIDAANPMWRLIIRNTRDGGPGSLQGREILTDTKPRMCGHKPYGVPLCTYTRGE